MRFQKIKYNGSQVVLRWVTKKLGGDEIEQEVRSFQTPHPEFVSAMRAFILPALELLELPEDYDEGLTVTGLSINEEEDGRLGLVVTMQKKLAGANAPLVLNTPHLRQLMDEEYDGNFLPDEMLLAIEAAERCAKNFIDGKRAQADMFEPDSKEKAAGETTERELALV